MLKGLLEAFQPDYLVELNPGAASSYGITFPEKRILAIDDLSARDERRSYDDHAASSCRKAG